MNDKRTTDCESRSSDRKLDGASCGAFSLSRFFPGSIVLFILVFCYGSVFARATAVALDSRAKAIIKSGRYIELQVKPKRGDGYIDLARRYTKKASSWKRIRKINPGRKLLYNRTYRIPFYLLSSYWQAKSVTALFSEDAYANGEWRHKIRFGAGRKSGETISVISFWFTGSDRNESAIKKYNNLKSKKLKKGQTIRIPDRLLTSAIKKEGRKKSPPKKAVKKATKKRKTPTPGQKDPKLRYARDRQGRYAVYRLQKGEALYSSVVLRFTDRITGASVNEAAKIIAQRSNIKDLTKIPVNYPVKIPVDLLSAEFMPPDDQVRIDYEKNRKEVARTKKPGRSSDLRGVHIVLDPGHGGVDPGASAPNILENEFAYDVACRIKRLIETKTQAKVYMTVFDKSRKYKTMSKAPNINDSDEVILTNPPYLIRNSGVAVHLRWYLSNYIFTKLRKQGVAKDKVIFTSIHADSLDSRIRGATIYVPGAMYCKGRFGKRGGIWERFREVKSGRYVSFSYADRIYMEGMSRSFAREILNAFRGEIAIYNVKPIRDVIYRNRPWVPAVLRFNKIPTKLLIEVANLNNRRDRGLMQKASFRQKVAEKYVQALINYYS